ncbi:hypothetical protein K7432_005169 [Basidiobolus ranarum]|uniref:Histone H1 n=1 Tax=Basidiobolus ranarum TaxID=34480 RepID=A0ABR2W3H0_9FUNG
MLTPRNDRTSRTPEKKVTPVKAKVVKPIKKSPTAKKATNNNPTYKDMITAAIVNLKERNGSSRQAIKKYIQANYKVGDTFDNLFNLALKRSVTSEHFTQPKGPSGPVKLAKKPTEPKPKLKPVEKKENKNVAKEKKSKKGSPTPAPKPKEKKPKGIKTKEATNIADNAMVIPTKDSKTRTKVTTTKKRTKPIKTSSPTKKTK